MEQRTCVEVEGRREDGKRGREREKRESERGEEL